MKAILLIPLFCLTLAGTLHADGYLPKKLGNMSFMGSRVYDTAGMGLSLRYQPEEGEAKLDVYLYTYGIADLKEGESDDLEKAFSDIMLGIKEMEERGYYQDVRKPTTGSGTIELAGRKLPFYWGGTTYNQTSKNSETTNVSNLDTRASFYFITVYDGRFLKIRYTKPSDDYEATEAEFKALLEDFEKKFNRFSNRS